MSRVVTLVLVVTLIAGQVAALPLRPITVEDCVRTRRIVNEEVRISPDGSEVAYVVKAPNLTTDQNDYLLYVRDLRSLGTRQNGHMLLRADRISGVRWAGPERLMALTQLVASAGDPADIHLTVVDTATGKLEAPDLPGEIEDYSASSNGDKIVFAVKAPADDGPSAAEEEKVDQERGYPIAFGSGTLLSAEGLPEDEIFLATRREGGKFAVQRLSFLRPQSSVAEPFLRDVSGLDLSPDGKYLLLKYSADRQPAEWENEPYFERLRRGGTPLYSYVLGLYEIESSALRLAFNFPGGFLDTRWSQDSQSYSVVSPAPFGTGEAKAETGRALASGDMSRYMLRFEHVFAVDPRTRMAMKVVGREDARLGQDLPLCWANGEGPMLVRTDLQGLAWVGLDGGRWKKKTAFDLPNNQAFFSNLDSDGRHLVGVQQTTMIPPDLFELDLETGQWSLLTDLNPEYRDIELGQVERLAWANRYGSQCAGFLIKPVGYKPGKRYPMVLLSAPPNDVFISDAVYTTAYAPQPLANAGFAVVISQYPLDNRIPRGRFSGEMSTAYNWMAMMESAVDLMVRRGLADPHRIGIAGFSRTSWLTDFTLTHSTYRFLAASSADSGIYTYGEYFRHNSRGAMTAAETQVGGPPYGRTLRQWLEYAPPFCAEKVRTAILMEYTRDGEHGFEFFTALSRLGKPVEFYRYPNGAHPLDSPLERVASLERNVEWFRFWMQGYEAKAPSYDAGQYDRWRALRARGARSVP